MSDRPVVLVTEGSAKRPLEWLREHAEVLEIKADAPEFPAALARAEGLVVRTYTRVTEPFLAAAPRLRVVGRGGVGLENIDVGACRARGAEVVYTPDANTLAVGEFVMGAMLQLVRPWAEFPAGGYAPAEFKRVRDTQRGRQLNEMTLGILGLGRVGRRVAHLATAFGMRVLFHDIDPALSAPGAARVSFEGLLAQSDVLTVHTDMRAGNHHLMGRAQISAMKPASILINYARGELLDVDALAEALRAGRLAGAAIDVFDPEPPPATLPLLGLPNVLLTPHMAARTETAIENMSWVVRDVVGVLQGRPPQFPAP